MKSISDTILKKGEEAVNKAVPEEIMSWPQWKLEAMCLDKSDIEIKHFIETRRSNIKASSL